MNGQNTKFETIRNKHMVGDPTLSKKWVICIYRWRRLCRQLNGNYLIFRKWEMDFFEMRKRKLMFFSASCKENICNDGREIRREMINSSQVQSRNHFFSIEKRQKFIYKLDRKTLLTEQSKSHIASKKGSNRRTNLSPNLT